MKISYLVTCCNEGDTLNRLLTMLKSFIYYSKSGDEMVVLDDFSTNQQTLDILNAFKGDPAFSLHQHRLNNDYGAHKNYGNTLCTGGWIFQIDGDERPTPTLLGNLSDIIESNPEVELIYVPRVNDFRGVNAEKAAPWGWRLSPSPSCNGRLVVNWPDHQGRIYKNVPDRIRWDRKLHEKIEGHKQYSFLPAEEDLALYHDKTIEKQLETNLRYNKDFSVTDNQGHKVT